MRSLVIHKGIIALARIGEQAPTPFPSAVFGLLG